jgi:hypothetical protein
VAWVEVFLVLIVCHLAGDFILQTDWQAKYKYGGLGPDPVRRRALGTHIVTYVLCFLPALVWIAAEGGLARAVLCAIVVAVPHWVQDDGRLLDLYMSSVKGTTEASPGLRVAVDQSFHVVALFLTALLIA